jgi:RNA polymerase sigma-70 factor (ECF subfamily)
MYYQYNQFLYSYFYKRIKSAQVCEDLVQETFIRLWKYRKHLNETLAFNIQLFRIAKTALVDIAKRTTKAPVTYVPCNELPDVAEEDNYPIASDKREKLQYLIASLPPVRKKILDLKINGYSNKEIASQLTITVKTVENNINSAYRELRKLSNLTPLMLIVLFC